ncbi:MAG: hypothetical protein JRI57_00755 [Deltaproteobacteria bacterium]|nr:hypothetical protein [Deltaproteobacteria bacterium]MBW1952861.1 hypothetical protein [Deltaproteobacteria bacterium]MBW1985859.1 hypothetical protein [Deltaproteobacteria bacterium]MBW2133619.1 hypothetical protein [Deltaproteobacteria bacterium]
MQRAIMVVMMCSVACWGCSRTWHPQMLQGLPLAPGRYLTFYYQSPDFKAAQESYRLEDFALEKVSGVDKSLAARIFQEELVSALENNGLTLKAEGADCTLSGQVAQLYLRGPVLRLVSGKSSAALSVAGEIRRGPEVVFAFADQVQISLPINPRYPTSMEPELMVRQVLRRFAGNLLNEMLLPPPAPRTDSIQSDLPVDQGVLAEDG